MITAVQKISFCAGHRVWKHPGKCSSLHGHNYTVFFHATAPELDELGRVVDFGVLSNKLGSWINTYWDHAFICHREDDDARRALEQIVQQKIFLMANNPTAENMASYLLSVVGPRELDGTGASLVKVVVWETEDSFAEVTL